MEAEPAGIRVAGVEGDSHPRSRGQTMKIRKSTLTTEAVEFKNVRDVLRTLQRSQSLTVDVKEITNSSEFQALLKHLASIERPFGICIARAKETK